MSGSLDFARPRSPRTGPDLRVLGALLALTAGAFALWSQREPAAPAPQGAVEVRGEVPAPGLHLLPAPARTRDALAAAGAPELVAEDRLLRSGDLLVASGGEVRWGTVEDGLVYGLPININSAGEAALAAVPGIGARTAAAIVADRAAHGPFESVAALDRVKGIGPKTVDRLAPFLVAGAP